MAGEIGTGVPPWNVPERAQACAKHQALLSIVPAEVHRDREEAAENLAAPQVSCEGDTT